MSTIRSQLDDAFGASVASPGGVVLPKGSLAGFFDDAFGPAEKRKERDQARARKRAQVEREARGDAWQPLSDVELKANRAAARKVKREAATAEKVRQIAVLDMETDPFDAQTRERIAPFCAYLYSDQFEPVLIWEENEPAFVDAVLAAIAALPGAYTIYAHNGGKFDYMFLIHRLRGRVSFKGRGIMSAMIGPHELRDSFHVIPERLAAYQKQVFDYTKLTRTRRADHRQEIIDYLISDCLYLFDIIKSFVTTYGMKISIGAAAMMLIKREYPEIENVTEHDDSFLRNFFYGGRVECIEGCGEFTGDFKLYDVNSMYPAVMATQQHPVGRIYRPRKGTPTAKTCFIDLQCFSRGAFPVRSEGEGTTFPHAFGRYRVSIHEYRVALKYKLIDRVTINYCVDNDKMTTFERFVIPLYENRLLTKDKLKLLASEGKTDSAEYFDTKKDDIFFKLLMNNGYGKFCENPRRFRDHYLTDPLERPSEETETWGKFPSERNSDYAIWQRPVQKLRFRNVGTGASITGAARAVLLEAMQNATGAVYCDTDSLICKTLSNVTLHPTELGAWDLEAEMTRVFVAGKKLYAFDNGEGSKPKIKSKGVAGLTLTDLRSLIAGENLLVQAKAPTLTKTGTQTYIDRTIRATAKRR